MQSLALCLTPAVTLSSLELVDFINASRKEGEAELRHDHFMAKVPKVLGEDLSPKFLGTAFYVASANSREAGMPIDKVRDARFGVVNAYHESMLKAALEILHEGM
ncbi:hypothetical protein [Iodobacter sp.]|uniref:hypothetical protein n=1 Tax=Iodobacter sp. TaxID=1915058 RepID=UPI0025F18E63|nr:hypothetical protein [Iodobacter sp.]